MALPKLCLAFFATFLMSSCAGTYNSYVDMFKVALTPTEDVTLTFSDVEQAEFDYVYVRYGEKPRIAMALMLAEKNQYKWVSADQSLLITENGRIVKTLGLANDLLYLTNRDADPLKQQLNTNSTWERQADWSVGEYGYLMRSSFDVYLEDTINIFSTSLSVTKVIETVTYVEKSNYFRLDGTWQNVFWIDALTGRVLKSQQQLGPGMEPLESVYISEIVRRLKQNGVVVAKDAI
ncbi:YjbF family lipoprotein [Rheinheimera sp. UJ51]|uniref:YjbF family lipoprotein n=1 Tax=Rheinheimera sp. UJ51 TaxID=2892446 RepID=UPI001E497CDD|nr:YjbF family lipoprotein [Rheinheimera sp. UJ51]MCC5450244.1 YjbF family lipoprotein [Rheinheimera sp. UJ51]